MASQQVSGDRGLEMQEEKPSFFNKVKAKAKVLKSKMKTHVSTEDSHEAAPTSGDPHGQAQARGPTDQDLDQSDTSESDIEAKNHDIPNTPLSNSVLPQPTRPAGARVPSSEGEPVGALDFEDKTDAKSLPEDPSVLKSKAPSDTEQAVPTNYSYYNADPEKAIRPSDDDASQRKQEDPSSLGVSSEESEAITPAIGGTFPGSENSLVGNDDKLSKSGDREAELPRSTAAEDDTQSRTGVRLPTSSVVSQDAEPSSHVGSVDPSDLSEESLLSHPVEQDRGVLLSASRSHPPTPQTSTADGQEFSGLVSGDATSMAKGSDGVSAKSDPETLGGVNYDNASAAADEEDHHQGYNGLAASAAGVAGAGGVAAAVHREFDSSRDEAPAVDDDTSSKWARGHSDDAGLQPAAETGSEELKTSAFGTHGSDNDTSFLSSQHEDLGRDSSGVAAEDDQSNPLTSTNLGLPSNEREPEPLDGSNKEKSFLSSQEQDLDQDNYALAAEKDQPEPLASLDPNLSSNDGEQESLDVSNKDASFLSSQEQDLDHSNHGIGAENDHAKTLTSTGLDLRSNDGEQEFLDGPSKDGPLQPSQEQDFGHHNSGLAADEDQPNPLTGKDFDGPSAWEQPEHLDNRETHSVNGLENGVPNTMGSGDHALSDSIAGSKEAFGSAIEGKDNSADSLSHAKQAPSLNERPLSEKTPEATDATEQNTSPDQHTKTFVGSISNALGGLPGMFTSKSRVGEGGSPASTPANASEDDSAVPAATTPSSDPSSNSSTRKDTPYPAAAAPGLLDRMSGIASSLFGGGAKQPAAEEEKAAEH